MCTKSYLWENWRLNFLSTTRLQPLHLALYTTGVDLLPSCLKLIPRNHKIHPETPSRTIFNTIMDNRTDNRLTCIKCKKTFTTIGNLRRHETTVHATVWTRYQCWYCDKLYWRRENAAQHIKKLHPDQDINITKKLITNPKTTATKPGPWIPPAEALTKTIYRLHFKSRRLATPTPEDRRFQSLTPDQALKIVSSTNTPTLSTLWEDLHVSNSDSSTSDSSSTDLEDKRDTDQPLHHNNYQVYGIFNYMYTAQYER